MPLSGSVARRVGSIRRAPAPRHVPCGPGVTSGRPFGSPDTRRAVTPVLAGRPGREATRDSLTVPIAPIPRETGTGGTAPPRAPHRRHRWSGCLGLAATLVGRTPASEPPVWSSVRRGRGPPHQVVLVPRLTPRTVIDWCPAETCEPGGAWCPIPVPVPVWASVRPVSGPSTTPRSSPVRVGIPARPPRPRWR